MANDKDQSAKEPLLLDKQKGQGRPEYSDEQYMRWLEEMRPWLRQGHTLNYSMEKAGLTKYRVTIYEKYRLNDWFSEKVDILRSTVGEMINAVGFKTIESVHTRMIETDGKIGMSSEETRIWQTMAEKHRAAQPFFVNRTENLNIDESKVGKILDVLEATDYDELGQEAAKQMVEIDAPVQNQDETGADNSVPAELPTT